MSSELTSQTVVIRDLFSDRYRFEIPNFQRPYSWTEDEAGQLFSDVYDAMCANLDSAGAFQSDVRKYFMGGLVVIKSKERTTAEVVDGQQRLVTLTILLAALRDMLDPDSARDLHERVWQPERRTSGIDAHYRLTPGQLEKALMRAYVQEPGATLRPDPMTAAAEQDADERPEPEPSPSPGAAADAARDPEDPSDELTDGEAAILANRNHLRDKLALLTPQERIAFATYLTVHCQLILISVSELDEAYNVFSIMHTRGLSLSFTDVLKAQIVGAAPKERRDELAARWRRCEARLGRKDFESVFEQGFIVLTGRVLPTAKATSYLREVGPARGPVTFMDSVLEPQAAAFKALKTGEIGAHPERAALNRLICALNCIRWRFWLAPAILWLSREDRPRADDLSFFRLLERYSYFLLIRYGADRAVQKKMADALNVLRADVSAYAHAFDIPRKDLRTMLDLIKLKKMDSKSYVKPLLLRANVDDALDLGMTPIVDLGDVTIEHILPQTPQKGSQWQQDFRRNKRYTGGRFHYRIGNLIPLTSDENGEADRLEFADKKEIYARSKFASAVKISRGARWTPAEIDSRTAKIINGLVKEWGNV